MREFTYNWEPEEYTDDGPDPILKISKSSNGQFNWCPTKYHFNYREKIPQKITQKSFVLITVRKQVQTTMDGMGVMRFFMTNPAGTVIKL